MFDSRHDEIVFIAKRFTAQKYLPLLLILSVVVSIFPLSYGLANHTLGLSIPSGIWFLVSLGLLVWESCMATHMSDRMLQLSEEELCEMSQGIEFLKADSPSKLLH